MAEILEGNAIIGQSGGPTAVINSSLAGVIEEIGNHPEIENIYGMVHGIQGLLQEDIADLGEENIQIIKGLMHTPSSALGSCRYKVKDEDYKKILGILEKNNIRYFFYIGGNDSADTSYKINQIAKESNYKINVIGIPKTIDNDLGLTDHCPGYGSVARFMAIATMSAGKDTEAIGVVDNVKIIEAMGRNAGWITASSVLGKKTEADAPHLIYLPERPIIIDNFLQDVQKVYDKLGYAVVVVCEGVKGEGGKTLVSSGKGVDVDAFGHKQMGGVADFLCKIVAEKLKLKARSDKPGTIQRMFMPVASNVDINEAYLVGQEAVKAACENKSGYMVTLERVSNNPYQCKTGLADLKEVANAERILPDNFINKEGNFVTQEFIDYAKPLIGDSLPEYVKLKLHRI
ncbi:MAG: 6-phosphofructokinase [bacterium]